jgi:alkylation response protein AidB-like acyl-CoA dehydrogenase
VPSAFHLSDEQQQTFEDARRIAREVLAPIVSAGEPGRVNRPLVKALGGQGLLARLLPVDVHAKAGSGHVSAVLLCLLREALARESTEAETALAMQALGVHPVLQAGSHDLVRRWVAPVARGEAVAAFALSEPEHGSDAAAIELKAERDGDGYRLSGVKTWISNAPDAHAVRSNHARSWSEGDHRLRPPGRCQRALGAAPGPAVRSSGRAT